MKPFLHKSYFIRIFLLIISFSGILSFQSFAQTVNALDFGLEEGKDATIPVLKALQKCSEINAEKLIIPKGKYLFFRDKAFEKYCAVSNNDNGKKRISFPLTGFKNFEIDANGSEFIFHGHMMPFLIEDCENLYLHGFSIDWDKPFHLQAEVVSVNKKEHSFDMRISEENSYKVVEGELMFNSAGHWQNMQHNIWFDPNTLATVYKVDEYKIDTWNPDNRTNYKATDLGNRLVRIQQEVAELPEMGWIFVVKGKYPPSHTRLSPGIHVFRSSNLFFNDINIYHAGGMGIIAERSADISLENFNVLLHESSSRVVSTTADATHFVNCKGTIRMENCVFENMMDDATNIHGVYAKVFEKTGESSLGAKIVHYQQYGFEFAEAGDSLLFVDSESLIGYQKAKVLSVKVYNEEYFEMELDREISPEMKKGDGIENISWSAGAEVRNCIVRRNRARSMLFSTRGKVVVEGNYFSSMMAGIQLAGGLGYWCESGPAEEVLIRNNSFKDCCTGNRNQSVILIQPKSILTDESNMYYHRNIRIENNTIISFDRSIINAYAVDGLYVIDNQIEQSGSFPPRYPENASFEFKHCRDVHIIGNEIKDVRAGEIKFDAHTGNSIEIRKNKGFGPNK